MSNIKPAKVNKDHGNAGSCKLYIDYLEKENIGKPITEREYFFNDKNDFIPAHKAQDLIDSSPKQGIRGKDAKYFEVIMSFTEKELKGKTNSQLKNYVKEAFPKMYAESVKGKTVDPEKLIWVAKLEQERRYKATSPDVKNGIHKNGELKAGDQRHFHIIVARKTSDNKMSISPLNTFKKGSSGVIKSGFEKNHLRQAFETSFDKKFNYDRPFDETFRYQNTMKHGTVEAKKEVHLELVAKQKDIEVAIQPGLNTDQQQQKQGPPIHIKAPPQISAKEEEDEEIKRRKKKNRGMTR